MEVELDGYSIKVSFWGDSTTPMYKYKIYKPKKFLGFTMNQHVYTTDFHRRSLIGDSVRNTCPVALKQYKDSLRRWS